MLLGYFILLSVFLLFVVSINIIPSFGFTSHKEIFNKALPFLKDEILNVIDKASLDTDNILDKYQYEEQYHFDGCNFFGSTKKINELYQLAVRHQDAEYFGRILHIVQDFYSHSNWVNFGRTDLVDDGLDEWKILSPFQITNSMVVLEGTAEELKKKGMDLKFEKDPYKVYVTTPNGEYQGLITGIVPPIYGPNRDNCPYPIETINPPQHGMIPPYVNLVKGLAKDAKSYSPLFYDAFNLAVNQTQHEWCRLVNLVEQKYGEKGVKNLIDEWVEPSYLPKMKGCPQKWNGEYYDKIKITYKQGNIEDFSNIGKFNFYINNDNSISGKGMGHIKTPFDDAQRQFNFIVNGFYDDKTDSVRLKFSDFTTIPLSYGAESTIEMKATILYKFYMEPTQITVAKFLNHGPLCNKLYDINQYLPNEETNNEFVNFLAKSTSFFASPILTFKLFGDPGYIPLCENPEVDISLKTKKINVHNENMYEGVKSMNLFDPLGKSQFKASDGNIAPEEAQKFIEDHEIKISSFIPKEKIN